MKNLLSSIILATAVAAVSFNLQARDVAVKITEDKSFSTVHDGYDLIKVARIQDTSHTVEGSFAKTSRPCPPFCVTPLHVDDGVTTVGELELIKFMETSLYRGTGVIIDARTPAWYHRGTIPGSINIKFTYFQEDANDPELAKIFRKLGAVERNGVNSILRMAEGFGLFDGDQKTEQWDFSDAKELLLWCNGSWCDQSPRAIRGLLKAGYPAEKLFYYRGGMQSWQSLGFTTIIPRGVNLADKGASSEAY